MVKNDDGIYNDLYKIENTTSDDAAKFESKNGVEQMDADTLELNKFKMGKDAEWYNLLKKRNQYDLHTGMDEYLKSQLKNRSNFHYILRGIYNFFRAAYVCVWFYFLPMFAMFFQFVITNFNY